MSQSDITERDAAEMSRSAAEARDIQLTPCEVERYLDPSANTRFALEFAFYLLGDVKGKTVLDVGCGTGESLVPLLRRGANARGIDISPELIALANSRLSFEGLRSSATVGSVYHTGLPDRSVDVIFAMAIIHHLDLIKAREEFKRILRDDGYIILKEPIRYSKLVSQLRKLFPDRGEISEYEHPITEEEMNVLTEGFKTEAARYFRLPWVSLVQKIFPTAVPGILFIDRWLLRHASWLGRFATVKVMKLRKA